MNNLENRESVAARIRTVITTGSCLSYIEESQLTDEASFSNDLGADSLDMVEFVMDVEKEFNITITDADADKFLTLGDVIDYVSNETNGVS